MSDIAIELGGQTRKFSFGLEMLGFIQMDAGIGIEEFSNTTDTALYFILIKSILYRGHERECKKDRKPINFTIDDVDSWIEEKGVLDKDIMSVWIAFNQTFKNYLPKEDKKVVVDSSKKK